VQAADRGEHSQAEGERSRPRQVAAGPFECPAERRAGQPQKRPEDRGAYAEAEQVEAGTEQPALWRHLT
jgi:hypothetical protein